MTIDQQYRNILSTCKFIAKPDTWYVEGTECKVVCFYIDFNSADKAFSDNAAIMQGYTNEIYKGFKGDLPRPDEEGCSLDEFFIYDKDGREISELTLSEYRGFANLINSLN